MTQIQTEIGRLQEMADVIVAAFPESKAAKNLAARTVPGLESLRIAAKKELDDTGAISSETYSGMSAAMGSAEDEAWKLHGDYVHDSTKMVCRQLDSIHIMMNEIPGLPVPEGHIKCWPPGSDC